MAISLADIFAARRRVSPHIRRTPLVRSAWLSGLSGGSIHLKLESLQTGHSFKLRGALNAALSLAKPISGEPCGDTASQALVTASAGNHGRALAYAARLIGRPAIIFTPRDAPRTKLEAIRDLGADLRPVGDGYEDAERQAKTFAAAHHLPFLSPYNHPDIIAGAGTVALEILDALPEVACVVVPVGGGGLIAGVAMAMKAAGRTIEIVGVEVEASPVFHVSLREGRITEVAVHPTIADGLAGNMDPESITFDLVRRWVDRMTLVGEDELAAGIRALAAHEHLIAEGAGAVGIAAVMGGRIDVRGRQTAIVVSGSNIDADRLAGILAGGA